MRRPLSVALLLLLAAVAWAHPPLPANGTAQPIPVVTVDLDEVRVYSARRLAATTRYYGV
jgi:hypothetical protein